jgi:membrane protease YdiL (CAAX protease family)
LPDRVDLTFAVLFSVVGAALDYLVLWPRLRKMMASGAPGARMRAYFVIMAVEWLLAGFVVARWLWLGRSWPWLAVNLPSGWRLLVSCAFVAAVLWLLVAQTRGIAKLNEEKRVALRPRLGNLDVLVPRLRGEYHWFIALSVTAGVCEELLYRGFLVWAMRPRTGLWAAAAISVALFGVAHAYQGAKGIVRTAAVGALFGALALLTGSLAAGIASHALIDILGGTTGYQLLRESPPAA